MPLHPGRGHAALRRGRLSLENQVYHVTTATLDRRPLFSCFATARAAIRNLNDPPVLGPHRLLAWVPLRAEVDLATVGRYIIANPLRAGLVGRVSAYPHWDAIWI